MSPDIFNKTFLDVKPRQTVQLGDDLYVSLLPTSTGVRLCIDAKPNQIIMVLSDDEPMTESK